MLTRFKNYLQSLSSSEQVYAINDMIDFIIITTTDTTIDINTKIRMIKERYKTYTIVEFMNLLCIRLFLCTQI